MSSSHDALIQTLASNVAFEGLAFERVEVAGLDAVVTRLVGPERAVALWRAARSHSGGAYWPLLTNDNQVHPDLEHVQPLAPITLAEVRAGRERVVRSSKEASAAFDAIARAMPSAELLDERDSFLEEPIRERNSLVLVEGSMFEAIRPFTGDGEGSMPRHAELVTMLQHWHERFGAEPLHADGGALELEVREPPRASHVDELRALARDFFLLSQGNREGFGIEDPSRLLSRLTNDRWVVWWYGTTS